MSFIDRHFIPLWISVIVATMAGLVLYFLQTEVQRAAVQGEAQYPWHVWVCMIVILASFLVPVVLFVHHRLSLRVRRIAKSVVATFE